MSLYQRLKGLFFPAPPLISEEQALVIAWAECKKRRLIWGGKINIQLTRRAWVIDTNCNARMPSATIAIDRNTGEVIYTLGQPRPTKVELLEKYMNAIKKRVQQWEKVRNNINRAELSEREKLFFDEDEEMLYLVKKGDEAIKYFIEQVWMDNWED